MNRKDLYEGPLGIFEDYDDPLVHKFKKDTEIEGPLLHKFEQEEDYDGPLIHSFK